MLETAIEQVRSKHDLTLDQMSHAVEAMMRGECSEEEIASLLLALREKGESVAEIAGAAKAMRRQMTPIRSRRKIMIDTCGTGGDGSGTFNISTAAAIVAAATGVPVAKHGNRRITSRSGSADVLRELGVNVEASVAQVERCLDDLGLCFCYAPLLHQAMKHVAPVRQKLGVPTIFNLLGPLCNPAGAPFQLLGVGRPALRPVLSQAMALLGVERVVVVHGQDGLDEVTLSGRTYVTDIEGGNTKDFLWKPEDFGLDTVTSKEGMLVDGPEASAAIIRKVLDGERGPARDIVVLNAAAALWAAGLDHSPETCAILAAQAVDAGAASELLERLAELSHRA